MLISYLSSDVFSSDLAIQNLGADSTDNSRILQAQVAVNEASLQLNRATVRSPTDGVVTNVRLDQGNFASAGTPQMTFIATRNIWLEAYFTENNLGHLTPEDRIAIVFDSVPGHVIEGRVREIGFGVAVDSTALGKLPTVREDPNWLRQAQRFPVLVDFDIPDRKSTRLNSSH